MFSFEPGFEEDDPVWTPDTREEKSHIAERARSVLDRAFSSELGNDATCESAASSCQAERHVAEERTGW